MPTVLVLCFFIVTQRRKQIQRLFLLRNWQNLRFASVVFKAYTTYSLDDVKIIPCIRTLQRTEPIIYLFLYLSIYLSVMCCYLSFIHKREGEKKIYCYAIGSCDYRGWEVPWSAICKLETWGSWWCRFQSRSEGLRTSVQGRRRWLSQLSLGANSTLLAFLFYSGPQQIGWQPPVSVRVPCFTHSTYSNANLFQNTLSGIPRSNV